MVPDLYAQAAWLQVTVLGEVLPAQVKHNGITGNRVGCYRDSGAESLVVARHIVRKTVPRGDYRAICHCQHGLAIGVVRALVACISRESCALFDLLPIDCVPPRNLDATLEDEDSAAVVVFLVITRAIVCKPVRSRHRRAGQEQRGVMSTDDGAFR